MSLGALDDPLRMWAVATPHRVAVRSGEQELTYAELDAAAASVASGLRRLGVTRGDRVTFALPNGPAAAIACFGVLRAGAAIVPLNPTVKAEKLAAVLADCTAAALVCDPALRAAARHAATAVPGLRVVVAGACMDGARSDDGCADGETAFGELLAAEPLRDAPAVEVDLAAVVYTSGSTGRPKGVTLTHRNMVFAATSISGYLGMTADDRVLSVLPLSFDYGLYQLLMCVRVGATLLLEPGVRYPGRLVRLLVEQRVTGLPGVPTLFQLLLALPGLADRSWPHLRFLTNTGAALSAPTITALRAAFPDARLYSMYGLTECKRVSYLPPGEIDRRPGSVGVAIPGTEVWIEDDEGRRVGPGGVGELMVRGPHVMQGYWNDPETTARRLRPGRWPWERTLATGDLFRTDDDGFLYFVARRDDVIKSRGEKVSPREVEDVLVAAPGVLDAAVVGVPDALLGQAVVAHVAPRPGHLLRPDELLAFCRSRLEDHLVPARIVVHDELPKTPNGKLDKRALAAHEPAPAARSLPAPAPAPEPGSEPVGAPVGAPVGGAR